MIEIEPEHSAEPRMGRGSPPDLLCIGNALVDVFAQGEENIDLHFGLTEKVQHIPMDRMREILSILPEFTICSGGGAANVAKIAGLLGMETAFMGAVGTQQKALLENEDQDEALQEKQLDPQSQVCLTKSNKLDQFGRLFEEQLNEAGVHTALKSKTSPTGICLMLQMPDGLVKIAACPSAAQQLEEDDIDEDIIRKAKVIVLDGYMLDRQPLVQHILSLADRYGTPVALDISSIDLASGRAVEILTYARAYPLIIFMNEDEANAFYKVLSRTTGEMVQDTDINQSLGLRPELIDLFKGFTANDIFPVITVKLGIRGAIAFAGGHVFREETIPVMPLETTGAGDAFCAAFLAGWVRDKPVAECAALGNKAAREVLDVKGAQPDPRALKYLEKLLR